MPGVKADFYSDGISQMTNPEVDTDDQEVWFDVEFGNGETGRFVVGYEMDMRSGSPEIRLARGRSPTVLRPVESESGETTLDEQGIAWTSDVSRDMQQTIADAVRNFEEKIKDAHGIREFEFSTSYL